MAISSGITQQDLQWLLSLRREINEHIQKGDTAYIRGQSNFHAAVISLCKGLEILQTKKRIVHALGMANGEDANCYATTLSDLFRDVEGVLTRVGVDDAEASEITEELIDALAEVTASRGTLNLISSVQNAAKRVCKTAHSNDHVLHRVIVRKGKALIASLIMLVAGALAESDLAMDYAKKIIDKSATSIMHVIDNEAENDGSQGSG